jgi:hypothetical protein
MATLTDLVVVAGLSQDGLTPDGGMDALQFGIPVRGGELWEFSFWMTHKTGDPDAQVIATWLSFDTAGGAKGAYVDDTSYAPNGYLLDTIPSGFVTGALTSPWVKYRMQHVIATKSDGLTSDPSGGVCGYIIPCIWWHAATPLVRRFVMGAMLTRVQNISGAIVPLSPDVYLTLGVSTKTLASAQSILGPP